MSATRQPKRDGADNYPTPGWATRVLHRHLRDVFPGGVRRVLEPAIGDGAIIAALPDFFSGAVVEGYDIRETESPFPYTLGSFLDASPDPDPFDLVITNPPFSLALEFVQHGLRFIHEHGRVIMLLRLAFLEGQKRSEWMRHHMPDVYVFTKRPSFVGKGTDSAAYAWMAWHKYERTSGSVTLLTVGP